MCSRVTFDDNATLVYEWCDEDDRRNYFLIDAMRFKRRIATIGEILAPILTFEHRRKIYCQRFSLCQSLIIDIQGFNNTQEGFTPKEMSIMDSNKRTIHFLFKPTMPFHLLSSSKKREVRWIERNHLNIEYSSGFVDLRHIGKILREACAEHDTVYVKGHQKFIFLKKILTNVKIINMEGDSNPPILLKTKDSCLYHRLVKNTTCACTENNVEILYNYVHRL